MYIYIPSLQLELGGAWETFAFGEEVIMGMVLVLRTPSIEAPLVFLQHT